MEFRHVHDVSPTIGPGLPVWDGDPVPEIQTTGGGGPFTSTVIRMGAHTGTHVDAPAHRVAGGRTVEDLSLEALVGDCRVVEFTGDAIDAEVVKRLEPVRGERILFKTRNSSLWMETQFNENFVHVTADGARALVDAGVHLVGVDYLSVESKESCDDKGEVHRVLLEANVVLVEGLNLDAVPAGPYTLVCLPLKLAGADGAPARAVLLEPA